MRYTTKQDQLNALCQPFPIEAVKECEQRRKILYYYPAEVVRARLNEVFAGDYEFKVNQVLVMESTMDMSCIFMLWWADGDATVVEECGSSEILFSKDGSRCTNDPAKTCSNDALERCLAFIGCGAELWQESYRNSLGSHKEASQQAYLEYMRFTCQGCGGRIESGVINNHEYTAEELLNKSRKRFHQRLCVSCTKEALKTEQSASRKKEVA